MPRYRNSELGGADVAESLRRASVDDVESGGTRQWISDPGSNPPALTELRLRLRTTKKAAIRQRRVRPRMGMAIMGISLKERGALWEGVIKEEMFAGNVGMEGAGRGGGGEGYNGKKGGAFEEEEVEEEEEGYFGKEEGGGVGPEGGSAGGEAEDEYIGKNGWWRRALRLPERGIVGRERERERGSLFMLRASK